MTLHHRDETARERALELLKALPFEARMAAYEDFDEAVRCHQLAHWNLRGKPLAWALEFHLNMRRARRAWKHYAAAVRMAKRGRMAA